MSLFPQALLAPFDAPEAPAVALPQEVQFKRPLAPSAKRKHAAMRADASESENNDSLQSLRSRSNSSAAHVRAKTESSLFVPIDITNTTKAEPVSPVMKITKKARLSTDKDEIRKLGHLPSAPASSLPRPAMPLPRPDIPLSFSFSGTRQETMMLTEQFDRMKIQEEDETSVHPLLSKSAHINGRKTLLEQESEDRIAHVRQIKNNVVGPFPTSSESAVKVHLPILIKTSQPDLNCVTPQTVAELLSGKYNEHYDAILVIDCRFDYEYEGGHIRGALNFPDSAGLEEQIFDKPEYQAMGSRLCLVFHCEFSSHRGPRGYKKFRSLDRKQNAEHYPHLDFPEMYLLEGGYRKFWELEDLRTHCEPCGYVEMKAQEYLEQCKEAMKPRGRSVSKVPAPVRRHFSMSCSNIFDGTGVNPEVLKPQGAREQLKFDHNKDDIDVDAQLFGGARNMAVSWTSR